MSDWRWTTGVEPPSSSSNTDPGISMTQVLGAGNPPFSSTIIRNQEEETGDPRRSPKRLKRKETGDDDRDNSEDPKMGTTFRGEGRLPGSNNKPKPPISDPRDIHNVLCGHFLDFAPGTDIFESISQYARRIQKGVHVLSAHGTISYIAIHQISPPGTVRTFRGLYDILSLTGTFLPHYATGCYPDLTAQLAAGQGTVVGGRVLAPLIAGGPVRVIASAFAKVTYERLPMENPPHLEPTSSMQNPR